MKIAIVRGSSLNSWELMNFAPLAKTQTIVAVGSSRPAYDIGSLPFPVKQLVCLGDVCSHIPGGIRALYTIFGDPQVLLGLEKAIRGFDIVHTAETGSYYSLQAVRAKDKGLVKRVIVTVWENTAFLGDDNKKRYHHKREVLAKADMFVVPTQGARVALLKEGAHRKKIAVVPLGVDVRLFQPAKNKTAMRPRLGLPRQTCVILFVGRFVKEKGIYYLIEAVSRLPRTPAWWLGLVGDGPERESVRQLIKANHLERQVKIYPPQTHGKMGLWYQCADMLVLPSIATNKWQEQYGMVLVEAMAAGTAVVASKSGAIPEVLGQAGLLVPERNSVRLGEAIQLLILNTKLRQKYAILGRRRAVLLYNSRKIASVIASLYRSVLGT